MKTKDEEKISHRGHREKKEKLTTNLSSVAPAKEDEHELTRIFKPRMAWPSPKEKKKGTKKNVYSLFV
jgi:hypothetical protein